MFQMGIQLCRDLFSGTSQLKFVLVQREQNLEIQNY